ncbi:hypothetical protein AB0D10_42990 [Kitasatospora sp. NPDC048545]
MSPRPGRRTPRMTDERPAGTPAGRSPVTGADHRDPVDVSGHGTRQA